MKMVSRKLPAMMVAIGICMLLPLNVIAENTLPNGPGSTNMIEDRGIVTGPTRAVSSFLDEFTAEHFPQKPSVYSLTSDEFAGPYTLLVSGAGNQNSFGMMLASLGLMALIAHRRRSI